MPADGLILVAGEALVDLVQTEEDEEAVEAHPGGAGFNVARTIGRLEQPVAYLGRLSTDRFGRRHAALLERDGVQLGAVVTAEDPTTLALAEVDRDGVARYRFYTEGTAAAGLTPEDALAALPETVSAVHAGTLALVLEPTATALEGVIRRLRESALVAIDPNCRPSAIRDADAYRARIGRLLGDAHLVKVSDEDLAFLEPDLAPVPGVRALLEHGPAVGLLTRGPSGALVVTRTAEVAVPAPPAKVIDTIGAGDAFGGGFLAWWQAHGLGREELGNIDLVVEASAFACLVAARTCARPGASPPHLSELGGALGVS